MELNIELETNNNLIWRSNAAGNADCRVILTRLQLFVPIQKDKSCTWQIILSHTNGCILMK